MQGRAPEDQPNHTWDRRYTRMQFGNVQKLNLVTEENARLRKVVTTQAKREKVLVTYQERIRSAATQCSQGYYEPVVSP